MIDSSGEATDFQLFRHHDGAHISESGGHHSTLHQYTGKGFLCTEVPKYLTQHGQAKHQIAILLQTTTSDPLRIAFCIFLFQRALLAAICIFEQYQFYHLRRWIRGLFDWDIHSVHAAYDPVHKSLR